MVLLLLAVLCPTLPTEARSTGDIFSKWDKEHVLAAVITLPYVYSPGEVLPAAYLNSDFQTIYNDYNGNVDNANIANAANITLTKLGLNPGVEAFNQQASAGNLTWASGLTTDTQPKITMTAGGFLLGGPGGTTAPDVGLQRSAAGTWQLTSPSGTPVNPVLDMNSGTIINLGAISGSTTGPVNGGRLYLTSGQPYGDSNATGTLYYGPATSNVITLYNGSAQVPQTFTETSVGVGSLSGMYDVYVTSATSTTVSISVVGWSGLNTPPTRSTDSYGRLCKNSTPTALLVGVMYVTSSNQTADNTSERFISNIYNAVPEALFCQDTTTNWSYGTPTVRAANANTTDGVGRCSFVSWFPAVPIETSCYCVLSNPASSASSIGIGIDSTTAYTASGYFAAGALDSATVSCNYSASLSPGFHYLQRLEYSSAASTTYFYSLAGATACNGLTSKVFN